MQRSTEILLWSVLQRSPSPNMSVMLMLVIGVIAICRIQKDCLRIRSVQMPLITQKLSKNQQYIDPLLQYITVSEFQKGRKNVSYQTCIKKFYQQS